jgi:eukaryotic-like serine/threonine-protein kinase
VRPPEDPTTRARVAELRHQLAGMKALYDSGRYHEGLKDSPRLLDEVRALGYQPLIAETL